MIRAVLNSPRLRFVVVAMGIFLLITACRLGGVSPADLDGRDFVSVSRTEGGIEGPLVAGSPITLTFRGSDIGAEAGCNSMGASYEIRDGRLIIGPMRSTMMACDPELMAQDEWLQSFLGSSPTVDLKGDNLTLTSGETVLELVDRSTAEPDAALFGTEWVADSTIDGSTVSAVPDSVDAGLSFALNDIVDVETGCNTGSGAYMVEGDEITFGPIATTRMACLDEDASAVEAQLLALLATPTVSYEISGGVLTLRAGDAGMMFSGGS